LSGAEDRLRMLLPSPEPDHLPLVELVQKALNQGYVHEPVSKRIAYFTRLARQQQQLETAGPHCSGVRRRTTSSSSL
jgi:hypothetical protein